MKNHPVIVLFVVFQMLVSSALLPSAPAHTKGALSPEDAPLGALALNGVDGYLRVPYSSELNSLSAITIEAWVKRAETSRNETVVGNDFNASYWLGFSPTGKLRFYPHGSGSSVDGNATVGSGAWNHIAVTYDGTTRNYYINGILDKTSTLAPGAITGNPSEPLGIGFDVHDTFDPNFFSGSIDEVRIWNVVRTQAEIQDGMFKTIQAPLPSSLLAYWKMDGNPNDQTNHHNGTMQGSLLGSWSWVPGGALPHDIRIPQVSSTPTLDGICSTPPPTCGSVLIFTLIPVTPGPACCWILPTTAWTLPSRMIFASTCSTAIRRPLTPATTPGTG